MVKNLQTALAFSQEKHLILQDLLTRLIINSQKEQYLKCIFMEVGTEIWLWKLLTTFSNWFIKISFLHFKLIKWTTPAFRSQRLLAIFLLKNIIMPSISNMEWRYIFCLIVYFFKSFYISTFQHLRKCVDKLKK